MNRETLLQRVQERLNEINGYEEEFAEVLQQAREGLTPIPTQGDAWSADARYIAGDTVAGGYVAIKYNRGKSPADYLGVYWDVETVTYQQWSDIEDGTVVAVDTIVEYSGAFWKCIAQHIKSAVYKPKDGSAKWEKYSEA